MDYGLQSRKSFDILQRRTDGYSDEVHNYYERCTNVITQKIAAKHGIDVLRLKIGVTAQLDRRGVSLEDEIKVPFPEIDLNIELTTRSDDADVAVLQMDLSKYCPISKILRESGTKVNENWTINRL